MNYQSIRKDVIDDLRQMTTKPRVVYTSIMGSIDELNEVVQPNDNVDYLCFTDNQNLRSKTWKIILCRDYFNSPRLTAKVFKLFPHSLFPDALESLWVDGNFEINGNITKSWFSITPSDRACTVKQGFAD